MIKDSLMEIGGVGLYGVVSILLFFTVFTLATAWALRLRRPFLETMSVLPLADGTREARKEASHE